MKSKLLYLCLLSLFFATVTPVAAQQLRISHLDSRVDLSFDLNRLYNYNSYEHNRWGAGFLLTVPLRYDDHFGPREQNNFHTEVFAAYGTGDEAWKYGLRLAFNFPRKQLRSLFVAFDNDLERVGEHSFYQYNLIQIASNSSYRSSRYSAVQRLYAGLEYDPDGPAHIDALFRISRERLLFDADGLLFPAIYPADTLPFLRYCEFDLRLQWGKHLTLSTLVGRPFQNDADSYRLRPYARFMAQYRSTIDLAGGKAGRLALFAQAGSTFNDHTRLARRFDVSGTGGSRFFFDNSFVTVRPNAFMADAYLQSCLRYEMTHPLWNLTFSAPRPFFQINALWGMLFGDHVENGHAQYELLSGRPLSPQEAVGYDDPSKVIMLVTPNRGVFEPALGINNILQQNYLAFGLAVAYQLTPTKSFYHQYNFSNNFAVMFTITVGLNED